MIVGAPGGPTGVTAFEVPEVIDDPAALFATTENEYVAPLLRPETTQLVDETGTEHVAPPGDAVTVYPVIGAPPSVTGALQETRALPLPSTADTPEGESGTVAGVAVAETVEDSESPTELVAMTRNV